MLKIREYDDNGNKIDLKELEKFGIKPIYKMNDSSTGKVEVVGYHSSKYCCKWGYLLFKKGKKPHYKVLDIFNNRYIPNYIKEKSYEFEDSNFIDVDLLYDLIKADLVEKVGDDNE